MLVQPEQSSLISALRKRRMSGTCAQGIISMFGSSAERNSTLDYVMLMDLQWSVPICGSTRPRTRVCPAVYVIIGTFHSVPVSFFLLFLKARYEP